MKKYLLSLVILVSLFSCDTKEKERVALQQKVDSLSVQLVAGREAEESMNEVSVLIDSIDASRNSLQIKMIEGSSYSDYVARLRTINTYVQQTEAKLDALEKSSKNNSKASSRSIRRLKADLEKRTQEIVALQLQLANARDENMALWVKINSKDSLLSMQDQIIKVKESDITSLEKLFNDTQLENKSNVANLYYAQAQALEMAAKRTQFAPRKKKETRREALELYKIALSLGKTESQQKIDELEKIIS